jgi:hypothetical protein
MSGYSAVYIICGGSGKNKNLYFLNFVLRYKLYFDPHNVNADPKHGTMESVFKSEFTFKFLVMRRVLQRVLQFRSIDGKRHKENLT